MIEQKQKELQQKKERELLLQQQKEALDVIYKEQQDRIQEEHQQVRTMKAMLSERWKQLMLAKREQENVRICVSTEILTND